MKIILYSTGCPRCDILEKKLAAAGIDCDIVNDTAIMAAKGYFYLPILEINDIAYEFGDAVKWIKEYSNGN